jgi:hypothetical protein
VKRAAAGLIAAIGFALAGQNAASAQSARPLPRIVSIPWVVTSSAEPLVNTPFAKNTRVEIGKAVPVDPVRLVREIPGRGKRETIPAGTTFAPANRAKNVICETERRRKMASIRCLADSDGDGAFDKVGVTAQNGGDYYSSTSYGYIIGRFPVAEWEDVRAAVPKDAFQPATDLAPIKFDLVIYTGSLFFSELIFNLCAPRAEGRSILGFPNNADYCFGQQRIPMGDKMPQTVPFAGGILSVMSYNRETGTGTVSYTGMKVGEVL